MARYKSTYTGPQIDSGVARALPGGEIDSRVARALPGGEIDQLRPNRNLLDNWDFRNPVNQRGVSTWSTFSYGCDRWKSWSIAPTINSESITIASQCLIYQIIESINLFINRPLTMSLLTDNGVISGTFNIANLSTNSIVDVGGIILGWSANVGGGFEVWNSTTNPITVFAVKLELGAVSTLANDPPADYGEELTRCKRYFNLWASEAARTAALLEVGAMRTTPVLSAIDIGGVTYYAAIANL